MNVYWEVEGSTIKLIDKIYLRSNYAEVSQVESLGLKILYLLKYKICASEELYFILLGICI